MAGFPLELKSGGKAVLAVDGTQVKGKWVNDDESITYSGDDYYKFVMGPAK